MYENYITIEKEDGSTEQMKIITIFKLLESGKNCLIYKSNNNEYYATSYDEINDEIDLNSDFTENERKQITEVLNTLYGGE